MFIRSNKDVDVYTRKIYSHIVHSKGLEYIDFLQQKLSDVPRKVIHIIIDDIYDYICKYLKEIKLQNEELKIDEIDESTYILDEAFIRYSFDKIRKHMSSNVNLIYVIKAILLNIKDVNSNILYALNNKNKDANIHIKYLISKYTDSQIKVSANVLSKLGIKSGKSVSICRFAELYERYVENRINEFETEIKANEEDIKLTEKDLLVYYYLKSYSKNLIDVRVEEIAKDCKISSASVSRSIKKLEKVQKIKVHKISNRNMYEIIEYKKETKEKKEQRKYKKTKKKINKNTEIFVSETDYKIHKKNEKLDKETKYKLYLYRQKYKEELENTKLSRLSRDDLLFFLINTEKFVENETLALNKILKIIKYADSNLTIQNPVGWLIARFMIGRGRFYFLLNNKKLKFKQSGKMKSSYESSHEKGNDIEQEKESNVNDIYINSDLAYFMKKYNISSSEISSYLSKFEHLSGDVSYIVERYLINKIYKNYLSQEEKLKLIKYAKQEIRKFAVPPETEEEFKEEIKSIIAAKIKDDYLTLSIQDRLRLQMSGQYDIS